MSFPTAGISKQIEFSTHSQGTTFAEAIKISRRHGGELEKVAGAKHPAIQQFLSCLKPDPRYQYVLMTPMGSFELWGMNVNGDIFPRIALSHDRDNDPIAVQQALERRWLRPHGVSLPTQRPRNFGYKTFLEAERYLHHINKDPSISYGQIVVSVWNPRMERIEVIVRHDRQRAKEVGAEQVIDDIDNNRNRNISMGCKVPFDVCSLCGNISRTRTDYCEHLRRPGGEPGLGRYADGGRACGAVNFYPRFFDLSDVVVPAGKESGVIKKVAHQLRTPDRSPGFLYTSHDSDDWLLTKTAGQKTASQKTAADKIAEITKRVRANTDDAQAISDREPDLPDEVLRRPGGIGKLLTTLGLLGIQMKPREFQYCMLCQRGQPELADSLREKRIIFRRMAPSPFGGPRMDAGDFSPSMIGDLLRDIIPMRSAFRPAMNRRAVIIIKQAAVERDHELADPGLDKIAQAYAHYCSSFQDLPRALSHAVESYPRLYSDLFGLSDLTNVFGEVEKTAGVAGPAPAAYFGNAHGFGVGFTSWNRPVGRHSALIRHLI